MKKGNPAPLSAEQKAEPEALAALPDSEIDTTGIPPVTDWSGAIRGPFYRPIKRPLSLRLDAGIVDCFQRQGVGCQTRIIAVPREYVERQRKERQ